MSDYSFMRSGQNDFYQSVDVFSEEEKQAGLAYLLILMEEAMRDAACYLAHEHVLSGGGGGESGGDGESGGESEQESEQEEEDDGQQEEEKSEQEEEDGLEVPPELLIMGLKRQFISQKNSLHDDCAKSRIAHYFNIINPSDIDADSMINLLQPESHSQDLAYAHLPDPEQGPRGQCICDLCMDMRHISNNVWSAFTPTGETQSLLHCAIAKAEQHFCVES